MMQCATVNKNLINGRGRLSQTDLPRVCLALLYTPSQGKNITEFLFIPVNVQQ